MRQAVGAMAAALAVGLLAGACGGGDDADDAAPKGDASNAATDSTVTTAATAEPTTSTIPRDLPESTNPCEAAGIEVDGCADFGDITVRTEGDQIVVASPDGERSYSAPEAVSELGGEVSDKGISVPLPDNVLFDFGSVALRGPAREKLALVAGLAKQSPTATIDIGGHTDSVGTDEFNQRLSEARAGVVREALAILGVERGRMVARGYGESRPVAPNNHPDGSDNESGRQQNRRVEILLAGAKV